MSAEFYSEDTLNWLLEGNNPSVRYLTMVNILGKPASDKEVVEAQRRIMDEGFVKKVLAHQNPDGSFASRSMIDRYGEKVARTGYQPKYKNTIWQAILLAQLGVDKNDERIKKLCNFILNANYNPSYRVLGVYVKVGKHKSGEFLSFPWCYIPPAIAPLSTSLGVA